MKSQYRFLLMMEIKGMVTHLKAIKNNGFLDCLFTNLIKGTYIDS